MLSPWLDAAESSNLVYCHHSVESRKQKDEDIEGIYEGIRKMKISEDEDISNTSSWCLDLIRKDVETAVERKRRIHLVQVTSSV